MSTSPLRHEAHALTPARCTKCSRLFFIRGKDPGWLTCHQCGPRADSGCLIHSRRIALTEQPALDGTIHYTERTFRDPQ